LSKIFDGRHSPTLPYLIFVNSIFFIKNIFDFLF
jgi:hypothetical protein